MRATIQGAWAVHVHRTKDPQAPYIDILSAGVLKGEMHRLDAKAIRRTTDIQHGLTTECRNPRTHCRAHGAFFSLSSSFHRPAGRLGAAAHHRHYSSVPSFRKKKNGQQNR